MEPIYELQITVPDQFTGDVMSDLNTRRGRIMGVNSESSLTTITAFVPLAECQRYSTDLRSITQGRGRFSWKLDHYAEVPHNIADRVVADASTNGHGAERGH